MDDRLKALFSEYPAADLAKAEHLIILVMREQLPAMLRESMIPMLREEVPKIIDDTLDRRNRIDQVTHAKHHEFLTKQLEIDEQRLAIEKQKAQDSHDLWLSTKKNALWFFMAIFLGWLLSVAGDALDRIKHFFFSPPH